MSRRNDAAPGPAGYALYDEECPFCRLSVALLLRWDRHERLEPAGLREPRAEQLLAALDRDERLGTFHFVDAAGRRHSGGDGMIEVIRPLPGGAPLARAGDRIRPLIRAGYGLVSGKRGAIASLIPERVARWARSVIAARGAPVGS